VRGSSADRFARELHRCLEAVEAESDRLVAGAAPDPATVHQLHRSLRQLRVGLAVWAETSRVRDRPELRRLGRRVRRLARRVGETRDLDIALRQLGARRPASRSGDVAALEELRAELARRSRESRELLRLRFRAARSSGLFEQIEALRHDPASRPTDVRLARYWHDLQERERAAVARAHRRARRKPTMRRLHRLRIRVRNWRHLSDFAALTTVGEVPEPPEGLRTLQRNLGRLHDLGVVEELAGPARSTRWVAELRAEQRRRRRRIVRSLKEIRPRELAATPAPVPPA